MGWVWEQYGDTSVHIYMAHISNYSFVFKMSVKGTGCESMVRWVLSMYKALGSIPSTQTVFIKINYHVLDISP